MNKDEKTENIARIICNKNTSFEQCLKNNNNLRMCYGMRKCRIEEKNEEQLDYIISDINKSIYLEACPGSGKTEVLALKAAFEINKWQQQGGMAFLTFTNDATAVIEKRVKAYNKQKAIFPHYIGTLHSFIHGYISQPYGYKVIDYNDKNDNSIKVIDEKDNSNWLNPFKVDGGKVINIPIYANQININPLNQEVTIFEKNTEYTLKDYYNRAKIQEKIKAERKIRGNWYFTEEHFKNKCIEAKNKFNKNGLATFFDMLCIAYKVLESDKNIAQKISKRYKVIFIDECQDLSDIEIAIIDILKQNGTKVHLIGDLDQAIYEYKNANPEVIDKYVKNNEFERMKLNTCFRCNQSIVDVFQKIVGKENIISNTNNLEEKCCYFIDNTDISYDNLVKWYNKFCDEKLGTISSRVVLTRGNTLRNKILSNDMKEIELPDIIQLWNNGNSLSKREAMNYFGIMICKQIKEGYKYNNFGCPNKIADTIIWKKFLASILNQTDDLNQYDKTYLEWYEIARGILKPLIRQNYKKYLLKYFKSELFENITFRCPIGKGKENINRIKIANNSFKNIRTIHSVKGQTFDSILLVSNDNMGKGTNWREWLGDKKSEYARIAYVASSRPKRLLIWAVSNVNKEEKEKLNNLGLEELLIKEE